MRIALCAATYRRPEGLRCLLEGIARLEVEEALAAELAVVIVDNSPDADARRAVTEAADGFPWPLHYVSEPRRGITFARNAALDAAVRLQSDFVAFIDDDEVPAPGWLAALVAAQRRSGAAAVLGAVEPVFPEGTPAWLIEGRFFETHAFADGADLQDAHTANVLIDLHCLQRLDLRFDHRYALVGGEDTMLFRDLLDHGGRIVYAAKAVVSETIPLSRTRLSWLLKRWYRTGNIETALFLRGRRRGAWRRPVNVLRGLLRVGAGGGLFLANCLVLGFGHKHRVVQPLFTLCRGFGMLASSFGWNYAEYREVHGT